MNQLSMKKMNEMSKKKKKGFTLVELIIVIAIIAILAAIAIPQFGHIRENANRKSDVATARNIQTAIAAEIADENATFDVVTTDQPVPAAITSHLDGESTPKVNGHTAFHYNIDANRNITITYEDASAVSAN